MPEEFGMDIAPNTASSIAVQLNQVLFIFFEERKKHASHQINRQPDPYASHCIDSWDNTGIKVPESTEYSLAVGASFLDNVQNTENFWTAVPAYVPPEDHHRDLQLLLAESVSSIFRREFYELLNLWQVKTRYMQQPNAHLQGTL